MLYSRVQSGWFGRFSVLQICSLFFPIDITWDSFHGVSVETESRVLLSRTLVVVERLRTEFMVQGCVNSIECARTVTELNVLLTVHHSISVQ
jgi:hypothetical protein